MFSAVESSGKGQACAIVIMVVRLVAIHREHGEQRNHLYALAQHIFHRQIEGIVVIGKQREHAARQGIHHIRTGRFLNDIAHKIGGKRTVFAQLLGKGLQFGRRGQLAKQEQIGDFLKAKPVLAHKAVHQLANVEPAIIEFAFARHGFAILFHAGHDIGNFRKAREHALTIDIAQPPVHLIARVQFWINPAIFQAQRGFFANLPRDCRIGVVNFRHMLCLLIYDSLFAFLPPYSLQFRNKE